MPNFMDINEAAFSGLCRSGLPGIVLVITFAQLTPSLLSKEHPLRFLQIPGVYSTVYIALLLENCGIVHFTYVLYGILNRVFFQSQGGPLANSAGTGEGDIISDTSSNSSNAEGRALPGGDKTLSRTPEYREEEGEEQESACEAAVEGVTKTVYFVDHLLLYVRYVLSTVLTVLCVVFVLGCIVKRHSMVKFAPAAQLFVFAVALAIITYCEGMKVAVVTTAHLDSESLRSHRIAYKIHKLLNVGKSMCCVLLWL